jgi:hypothetical protein
MNECNNPLNVKSDAENKWHGQIGVARNGTAIFGEPRDGIRAALICLEKKWENRKRAIAAIVHDWAPSDDHQGGDPEREMNDPNEYTRAVADWTGIGACEELCSPAAAPMTWMEIIRAMSRYENGSYCPWVFILQGYSDWMLEDWPDL